MKKTLALFLALALLLSACSFALADDVKQVTISIVNSSSDYFPKEGEELPQSFKDWNEKVKHLLPGYEITIDWQLYEDRNSQMPLLMAAGTIPDIFITDATQYMDYYSSGMFIEDLTDLVDQYGPNLRKNIMERSWKICTVGGNLACVPCENFYYKFPTLLRMDWVRKLGFEVKETYTLSEIKEICLAMASGDPDGNGVNDTYGLGTRYNGGGWTQTFMPIFGAFGGQPNDCYLDQEKGEVYFFNASADFRNALEYLNELYVAKAIDQECFILNYEQALINAATGKGGLYSGWWNMGGSLLRAGLLELQPDCDFQFIYITSDDGLTQGVADNGIIWKTAMISADCRYPEAAIAFIDFMNTEEGETNPQLRDENGELLYSGEPHTKYNRVYQYPDEYYPGPDKDANYVKGYREHWSQNLFGNMVLNQNVIEQSMAEEIDLNDKAEYLNRLGHSMQSNLDNKPVYTSLFYGYNYTDEMIIYSAALETLMKQWVVDFVTGAKPINDETWQTYLDALVAKGGQEVLDSMTKQYNDLNGTSYTTMNIKGK